MKTDKMFTIDFSRKFTPFVMGDELFTTSIEETFIIDEQYQLDCFNMGMDDDSDFFVVSFAPRPNTGKQPVADDVVTDVYFDGEYHESTASSCRWIIGIVGSNDILKWKPNHDAMLAKFKEQGANTVNAFTFENTKKATHVAMTLQGGTGHQFYANIERLSFELISEVTSFSWVVVEASTSYELIELSRPVGERKKDHTIDGVTTYALTPARQYGDQEAELATHYSGNNNRFYIKGHTMIRKAMVLDDAGRWIYSDCTTNAELDGDEFWKLDYYGSDQIIETWVGDHITEQKESACPGEPVFTQEMSDNGEWPPIGSVVTYNVCNSGADGSKRNDQYHGSEATVLALHRGLLVIGGNKDFFTISCSDQWVKPIDNRTPDEKIRDAILSILEMPPGVNSIIYNLLHSKKLTITLKD